MIEPAGTGRSGLRCRVAVYPGTFDPVTNGHLDIIGRATRLVDKLIVGVAENAGKHPLLPLDVRTSLLRDELTDTHGAVVEVVPFSGLLIDFAKRQGAAMIVRGLRAVSDFDYEFQMAGVNARLDRGIETVFLMASEHHQFISSRFVKEIARLGGDISSFVPPATRDRTIAGAHDMPLPGDIA